VQRIYSVHKPNRESGMEKMWTEAIKSIKNETMRDAGMIGWFWSGEKEKEKENGNGISAQLRVEKLT